MCSCGGGCAKSVVAYLSHNHTEQDLPVKDLSGFTDTIHKRGLLHLAVFEVLQLCILYQRKETFGHVAVLCFGRSTALLGCMGGGV